jgi:hypothetical protein
MPRARSRIGGVPDQGPSVAAASPTRRGLHTGRFGACRAGGRRLAPRAASQRHQPGCGRASAGELRSRERGRPARSRHRHGAGSARAPCGRIEQHGPGRHRLASRRDLRTWQGESPGSPSASRRRRRGIVDWLRHRPGTACPRVLTTVRPPRGALAPSGISAVVRRACLRCGLPPVGAHRLRHTAATELVRAGAGLREVALVLRHARLSTTAIYAKVDHGRLSTLAMPWPDGAA